MQGFHENCSYRQIKELDWKCKQELLPCEFQNLKFLNRRCLIQSPPQIIIQTNASMAGRGPVYQEKKTREMWPAEEQSWHINILKLLAVKVGLLTFTKQREMMLIHFQKDNTTALRYLLKIQGTKNKKFIDLNKKIWTYLFFSGDHHYSRISSQCNEYSGWLPVRAGERPLITEIKLKYERCSQDLPNIWKKGDRAICISSGT